MLSTDRTPGPRPPSCSRVDGFLFYFISPESIANLPSLSLFLWSPREPLSFEKGNKEVSPWPGCLCQGPA